MNVLMLLQPKSKLEYLIDTYTLRQGLEVLRAHSYTAIPVLDKDGRYVGTVREGDFLWRIVKEATDGEIGTDGVDLYDFEKMKLSEIIQPDYNPAVNINVDMATMIERSTQQNFVPIVDDRGIFIGIVTRRSVIKAFCKIPEKVI